MTEKELFCKVISAAMFPQTHRMPDIPGEQYSVLHERLKSHTLALLPAALLNSAEMPEALRQQWQKELFTQKLRFGQYLIHQEVLRIFLL